MLYQLRVASDFRQEDFAKRLGVPQSFISKIESGERRIDILELREILYVLGTDLIHFSTELERRLNDTK